MGVRAARRTSAQEAEPLSDVLVSGDDEPPLRPSRTRSLGVAALVLAGAAAVVVPRVVTGADPQEAVPVELALAEGSVALPRRDHAPDQGTVLGGVHVEVVNESRAAVRLLSGAVSKGDWQVAVVDDLDAAVDPGGRGRLLRPGWHAVLVLHRSIRCVTGTDHGPVPTSLAVEVEVAGRQHTASIDLRSGRAAEGGLAALLGAPERFCSPGGTAAAGTAGDAGLSFLRLWPAGTGVLPSP